MSESATDALQAALAGEHAAVYIYAALAAQADADAQTQLRASLTQAYDLHRRDRDHLIAQLTRMQQQPVAAAAAYELPNAARTTGQLRAAAVEVEKRLATVLGQLVSRVTRRDRAWAIAALTRAAQAVVSFGGRPSDFPGFPGLPGVTGGARPPR